MTQVFIPRTPLKRLVGLLSGSFFLLTGCGTSAASGSTAHPQPSPSLSSPTVHCPSGTVGIQENGQHHCLPIHSSSSDISSVASSTTHYLGGFAIVPGPGQEPTVLPSILHTLNNPQSWTRIINAHVFQYTANGVPFIWQPRRVTWILTSSTRGQTAWDYRIEPMDRMTHLSQSTLLFAASRIQLEMAILAQNAALHIYKPITFPSNALEKVPPYYREYVDIAVTNAAGNTVMIVENAAAIRAWFLNGHRIPEADASGVGPSSAFMRWFRQTLTGPSYTATSFTVPPSPSP